MLLLALDTATDKGSLALAADGRLLGEYSLETAGTYLRHLLPGLEALLKAAGREPQDIGAIAVSQGPGNFTGLRIGLATAKGLALARGCPLVAVSTLEVLAAQFPFHPHPIGVIIDARRREVFFALYRCPEETPQLLAGPERLTLEELPARLTSPMLLAGPALNAYQDFLEKALPPEIHWAPPEMRHPRAATVARLGRACLLQGLTTPPAQLTPTYLRPAL
ncbi:MAG: tRNA (adenosine(37)-N6)-threonylcarbamoyltransferase complex dimerization subunit type 1 TsaB [Deltaproteobacteria bacterium]|nr:tRNA (adenosine(37)-N6)-threonylcarbamoyltransferase complex dimerization subunit type 1 TsaB [Deltaproteobacteria bacterium]